MVERIPITDVSPVVERGRYPVKAVAGESLTVSANVFREGHDLLGAGVVLTDPQGRDRPLTRMQPTDEPGPLRRRGHAGRRGRLDVPDRVVVGPVRHLAARRRDQDRGRDRRRADADRGRPGAASGRPRACPPKLEAAPHRRSPRPPRPGATRSCPVPVRLAALTSPEVAAALHRLPAARPVSTPRAVPVVRRPRARALRLLVRVLPALRGRDVRREDPDHGRSGTFTTAAKRLDAVAEMGFDVVYLPPIHPIGEVNRKGPNNTLTPARTTPAHRGRSAPKDGGHDAVHPDLGTIEDFDAFVARAEQLGLEVALDLALQCAPDHPWVDAATRSGSRPAPTARSRTPRTRRRSTRTSTRSTSTTTTTGLSREVLRVVRYWMDHGVRIFRVDNPHTKPVMFWEWLLGRGPAPPTRTWCSCRRRSPRPAMMRGARRWSASTSRTRTSPGATPSGSSRSTCTSCRTRRATLMRPNLFVNTPDILTEYLQYGGPAAFRSAPPSRPPASPTWGVYAGFELYEHVAVKPGSEEYLDSEKYQLRPRDWEAAERGGPHPGAVHHPAQRDPPRATPPCSGCATSPSTAPTTTPSSASASRRRRSTQQATTTRSSWSSTSTRTARARRSCTSTCRRSATTGTTRSSSTTSITGEPWRWGETQLRAPRPVLRAGPRPVDPEDA